MENLNLQKVALSEEKSPGIWLFSDFIKCGFPSPAEGYTDTEIDFNSYIIEHPASSYCFYVKGDSMEGLHILSGDLVVIDRSKPLQNGSIIICCLEGKFTLKQFLKHGGRACLMPANPAYKPIMITSESGFEYWGRATRIIRKL